MKVNRTVFSMLFLGHCCILNAQRNQSGGVIVNGHSHGQGCVAARGNCMIAIFSKSEMSIKSEGLKKGLIRIENDSTLIFNYSENAKNEDGNKMYFENDLVVSKMACKNLHRSKIIIQKGTYPIEYSKNKFGTVRLKIKIE
jgi:hypothetical protein